MIRLSDGGDFDVQFETMKQTRLMSLVEAIATVAVGYGIAVVTQLVVFPWFGLPARVDDALAIGGIFTIVSIARGFALRRLFEAFRTIWLSAGSHSQVVRTRWVIYASGALQFIGAHWHGEENAAQPLHYRTRHPLRRLA